MSASPSMLPTVDAAPASDTAAPSVTSTSAPSTSSSSLPILPFHRSILDELSAQDGLVILARGLGLPQLLYHCIAQYAATSQLVLVLNVNDDVQREINERLTLDQQHNISPPASSSSSPSNSPTASPTLTSSAAHPPVLRSITNHVTQSDRQKLYLQGGCLAITTRILIVDLLNKLVAPDLISGLILNAAHRTTEDSTEAFILRIYRQHNSRGFLKAFSDEPQHFAAGFFGLDKVMRTLHCRCLLLYPRFHLSVQGSLSEGGTSSPDVHEMYQPLTAAMDGIQRALLECMDMCISSLKQENRIGAGLLSVTIETGLTKAFDTIIRHELDPIWHKVSPRTHQLVADLSSLRQCISHLIQYDAVTFYRYLLTVKAQVMSEGNRFSMWIETEAANRLFSLAKSRVYEFDSALMRRVEREREKKMAQVQLLKRARMTVKEVRESENGRSKAKRGGKRKADVEVIDLDAEETKEEATQSVDGTEEKSAAVPAGEQDSIKLVLEENPKWTLLVDILNEIEDEVKAVKDSTAMKQEEDGKSTAAKLPKEGRVLVCCNDERTCTLLQRYMEQGGRTMMKQLWTNFLLKRKLKKTPHTTAATTTSTTTTPSGTTSTSTPTASPTQSPPAVSHWALLAAETSSLRAELDRLLEQRRQRRLRKFERERRRRMAEEIEEKRRQAIGDDQITLTQHVRSAHEGKRKRDEEEKETERTRKKTEVEKERKRKKDEKAQRLQRLRAEEDADEDGILRDVLKHRDKRQTAQEIDDLMADDDEEREGEDGEDADGHKKADDWGVLSVCDVSMHISTQQEHDEDETDDNWLFSAPRALDDASSSASSIYHDCDESTLHALPSFQIIFHSSHDVNLMLYRFQPHYIVMFDPDLTLLRELEVYAAYHPQLPVTVYFCQYNDSVEQQRYLSSIKQEKEAFDTLIFQKAHMIVPSDVEGKSVGLMGAPGNVERTPAMRAPRGEMDDGSGLRMNTYEAYQSTIKQKGSQINTRRGGDMNVQHTGTVIVDVREFRSSLPSLLHSRGLTIIPVTLEVGDYVLSPALVVERKSLPDLFSSFLSGRLAKQMETLCRHYRSPVLLIEFDKKKPFSLLSKGELTPEINSRHIMSRIALLCIHFPQVRIVWSRDSHMTSSIFLALKRNQTEPELDGCALSSEGGAGVGLVGVSGIGGGGMAGSSGGGEDDDERVYGMMSFDMLRKLPGVNAQNQRLLMSSVGSLRELCDAKLTELMVWMGESNARKLFAFLHTNHSALFTI